ncbi:hypothetical protein ACJMK2_019852 [Sinanodonta woodiana]|uniref:Secreted protein n=1 Tax=Sinanodonta woodiana TaxID=1069815 RepID=A0ABD3TZU1_SINWO
MHFLRRHAFLPVLAVVLGITVELMYCSQEMNEEYEKKTDFERSKKLRSYTISTLLRAGCAGLHEPCHPFKPYLTNCEGPCEPGLTRKACRIFKNQFQCVRVRV